MLWVWGDNIINSYLNALVRSSRSDICMIYNLGDLYRLGVSKTWIQSGGNYMNRIQRSFKDGRPMYTQFEMKLDS